MMKKSAKQGLPVQSQVQAGKSWFEHYNACRQEPQNRFFGDLSCSFQATWRSIFGGG